MILEEILGGSGFDDISTFDYFKTTESSVIITVSSNYVVPSSGNYIVLVSGGGGSGAASYDSSRTASYTGGGGSGYISLAKLDLIVNETIPVTIGAGGAGVYSAGSNINGNSGGQTAFGTYLASRNLPNNGVAGGGTPVGGICLGGTHGAAGQSWTTFSDTNPWLQVFYDKYLLANTFTGGNGAALVEVRAGGGGASFLASGSNGVVNATSSVSATLGAGSGGCGKYNSNSTSGNGGDGFVVILKLEG